MLIPFSLFLIPLVYFHEYRKDTPFFIRVSTLLVITVALRFGIGNVQTFTDHFIAHSLFGLALIGLVYIFLISEELVFLFLYAVSSGKGGSSNHLHFTFISLIYLSNLILYYLNKSGIFQNSFFFFDPFALLAISTVVAIWSIKFKDQIFSNFIPPGLLSVVIASLGIIAFGFFGLSMQRGVDSIHQSFHYLILYAHLGFGTLFFLYIIINFIAPLAKGFEVFKIAYRERNFPYASARLAGLVVVAALFFLSGQEPYNLLKSGYYSYLSEKESNQKNKLLSQEYLINAEFLGYNTHYPNYKLAWIEWNKGNTFRAKSYFFNAAQRFPSPFAWVNYGNLEAEENPNKVRAVYEESLRRMESPEMKNNLGIIHLNNGDFEKALSHFNSIEASNEWNDAPLINKWKALNKSGSNDSVDFVEDFSNGNFGVKSNIIALASSNKELNFQFEGLSSAAALHRQAYLVNSTYTFSHDSIETFIRRAMDESLSGSSYNRLANALAIYLYNKGEVNKAFRLYDELQANSSEVHSGQFLDALGKLSLDQGAYALAEEFFSQAIRSGYEASRINRLEAFAGQKKKDLIVNELRKILEKSPELTEKANGLLDLAENFQPKIPSSKGINWDTLDFSQVVAIAKSNAFDETQVIGAVNELVKRDSVMAGYEILIESIEINPYDPGLLKEYILIALDWNLSDYAEQSLNKLSSLITKEEFEQFSSLVAKRREESLSEEW